MNRICHNLWEKKNQNFRFHSASNPKRKKRKKKKKKIYHYWVKLKWGFFFSSFALLFLSFFFPGSQERKLIVTVIVRSDRWFEWRLGFWPTVLDFFPFLFSFEIHNDGPALGWAWFRPGPWVRPESDSDIGSNEWRWFNHRRHSQLTKYQWIGREESGPMIALSFFN